MSENDIIKKYERKIKRFDKILKQGDRQQLQLEELNAKIKEQQYKLEQLYNYTISQQVIAKEKIESLIVNDFEQTTNIIFQASDTLSGDYYSLHKLDNGDTFLYILDGQGHGVAPALTIYAISSNILQILKKTNNFQEIIESLFAEAPKFLQDIEQISFTFLSINKAHTKIQYSSGGMYPFLINHNKTITRYKANNLPFMNFSGIPKITTIDYKESFDTILLYSDGIVEDSNIDVKPFHPMYMIQDSTLFSQLEKVLHVKHFEDDVTIINYKNPNIKN